MATYLQGVTDYIPQFQPFQPDLNFYANILQTKQTQYDNNWKALNNMYGKLYNADLTRDGNINKRDTYLKEAEFNLKRISQLDLSLDQNVNQATQIFKPLYEDKGLVKDMAWTKNYMMERSKGESFKNAYDEKLQDRYWDVGLRDLEYKREEFKKADDGAAMNFGNATYTPYVNSMEVAQNIAKEAGLSIESVKFSPDGRWIIKNKNGEQLTEPLSKLFEARLGNDPAIQAVYNTQAYVDRKDYAKSNAALFNNDENAAEMRYLEDKFTILKRQNELRYKGLQVQNTVYDSRIEDLKKQIANKKANPGAELELAQYEMNRDINAKVLTSVEQQAKTLNSGMSQTPSTEGGFKNPYGDLNSLRFKVDSGVASMLMSKDLNEAAQIFAYKDAKTDIESNPYKVMEEKHMYNIKEIGAKEASAKRVAKYKEDQAKKTSLDKFLVEEQGSHTWELIRDANGDIVDRVAREKETENSGVVMSDRSGNVVNEINMLNMSDQINKDQFIPVQGYLKSATPLIATLVGNKKMSNEQAAYIIEEPLKALDRFEKGKSWNIQMSANLPGIDATNSYVLSKDIRTKYKVKSGQSLYEAVRNGDVPAKEALALLSSLDAKTYSNISTEGSDVLKGLSTRTGISQYKMASMSSRLDAFVSENPNLSEIQVNGQPTQLYAGVRKNSAAIQGFEKYNESVIEWKKDAINGVKAEMLRLNPDLRGEVSVSDLVKINLDPTNYSPNTSIVDYLFDEYGNIRSQEEFYKAIPEQLLSDAKKGAGPGRLPLTPYFPTIMAYKQSAVKASPTVSTETLLYRKYNDLVEKANKAFTNSDVIRNAPPGFDDGVGTAVYTSKMKFYDVNTKSMGTSAAKAYEMLSTLGKLDLGNTKDIRISTVGSTRSNWDHGHSAEGKDASLALQIIRDLQNSKGNYRKDNPINNFGIAYKGMTISNPDYSGVVLTLPEDYVKTMGVGAEKQAEILQNGVHFMIPKEQISGTTIYQESTKDPISAVIDYSGEPFIYTDPLNSKNTITISKNDFGTSPYSIEMTNAVFDPDTRTEIENSLVDYQTAYGNDLTSFVYDNIIGTGGYFDQIRALNNQLYNNPE